MDVPKYPSFLLQYGLKKYFKRLKSTHIPTDPRLYSQSGLPQKASIAEIIFILILLLRRPFFRKSSSGFLKLCTEKLFISPGQKKCYVDHSKSVYFKWCSGYTCPVVKWLHACTTGFFFSFSFDHICTPTSLWLSHYCC